MPLTILIHEVGHIFFYVLLGEGLPSNILFTSHRSYISIALMYSAPKSVLQIMGGIIFQITSICILFLFKQTKYRDVFQIYNILQLTEYFFIDIYFTQSGDWTQLIHFLGGFN